MAITLSNGDPLVANLLTNTSTKALQPISESAIEPADGPMVCDSKISLSPEEIAFLKRGPRYMLRGNFSLRPGASRGQLKKFYPKYFKDILNLVCNFGFFGKALKLKMNII